MKSPRHFLAVTLLFWGWQVALWPLGIGMALLLTLGTLFPAKILLSKQHMHRIVDLCSLLMAGIVFWFFLGQEGSHNPLFFILRTLPVVLLPLLFVMQVSNWERIPVTLLFLTLRNKPLDPARPPLPEIGLDYPYATLCVVAAGTGTGTGSGGLINNHPGYYFGAVLLALWGLWPCRSPKVSPWTWGGIALLAVILGAGGQMGLRQLQVTLEEQFSQWFSAWLQADFDPSRTHTAIGQVGTLRFSNRIVLRVAHNPPLPTHFLLQEGVYQIFDGSDWSVSQSRLQNFPRTGPADVWIFPPRLADPGPADAGMNQPGMANSASTDAGMNQPGMANSAPADAGMNQPGMADSAPANAGIFPPGMANPAPADAGIFPPGMANPAPADAGIFPPGMANPARADAGIFPPGMADPAPADAGSRHVTVYRAFPRQRALLPLVAGTHRLTGLPGAELQINPLGSVLAQGLPGFAAYQFSYHPRRTLEAPPDGIDLLLPGQERPALQKIVTELGLDTGDPTVALEKLAVWFRHEFRYTLRQDAPRKGQTALSDFLLQSRAGHCEFFASATTLLLRAARIPARYVEGYAVQEYDPATGMHIVRHRDAHAWTRVYIQGKWQTFDTTPPDWLLTETRPPDVWDHLADAFSDALFRLRLWRLTGSTDSLWYQMLPWGGGFLALLWLGWRFRHQGWVIQRQTTDIPDRPLFFPLSPFRHIETLLAARGMGRQAAETPREWIQRSGLQELDPLVEWHYRFCYDPDGLTMSEQRLFAQEVRQRSAYPAEILIAPKSVNQHFGCLDLVDRLGNKG